MKKVLNCCYILEKTNLCIRLRQFKTKLASLKLYSLRTLFVMKFLHIIHYVVVKEGEVSGNL